MNNLNDIKKKLEVFKKKHFYILLFKSVSFFIFVILTVYIILNYIEYYSYLSIQTKTIILFSFITLFVSSLYFLIIKPANKYLNFNSFYTNEDAAKTIGGYFPDIKDKLINTVQLESIDSQELAVLSLNNRSLEYNNVDFNAALEKDKTQKPYILLFLAFILLVTTVLWDSDLLMSGSQRLLDFNTAYKAPSPFKISPLNTPLIAFKGEEIKLKIKIEGKYKVESAYLKYNGRQKKLTKEENNIYTYTLTNIKNDLPFNVSVSGFESENYTIKVLTRPELINGSISIKYPSYTGNKNSAINGIGNITVPEGSLVEWNINTEETNNLSIRFDSIFINTKKEGKLFNYSALMYNSKEFELVLKNENGLNKNKHIYRVDVIKDKFPTINTTTYEDTALFESIVLSGNIGDDYGFKSLRVVYKKLDEVKSLNIPISSNALNQSFYYVWNIDSLFFKDNTALEYYIEVSDNDGVNGSKKTKSKIYNLSLPDKELVSKKLESESDNLEDNLKKELEKLKENEDDLSKLEDKIKSKKKLDWQDKNNLKNKVEQQKQLHKELEKLKEKFNKLNQKQNKFKNQSESIKKKSKQLQKLMEELLDDETKKMMEELQKLLNENKPDDKKLKDLLDKMNNEESNLEKDLERAIDLYKQLKLDQKMEDTIEKLDELAEKQEELSKETEDKNSDKSKDELVEEQKNIDEKFDEIKEDLEKLNEMNKELNDNEDIKEETEEQKEEISDDLEKASDELEKNNKKKAGKSQKSASEKMKKMSQKMKEMQMGGDMEQEGEDIETLRAILENLLTLSFNQETLLNTFKKIKSVNPQFMEHSASQLKIKNDSKIIEDSLLELASRNFQIESFVTKELFEMNEKVDRSLEAIKLRKVKKISVNQQLAMTSMNNLALLLSDVLQQMQAQMAQKMDGDQQCNKPKNKPGGKKLSKMQQALNDKIGKLKKGGKQGKQLSEELAKLAAEQEAIREALKEAEKEGEEGENGKKGGNGKISEMMEETEKDLVNKRLLDKTLKRQEDILTRLLESEKAMRERDLDEKREAEQTINKNKEVPQEFEDYIKEKESQIELLKTVSPSYSNYYKKEINEYFKNETK